MFNALGPLDLVKCSALKELPRRPRLDVEDLSLQLEDIAQTAAGLINADLNEEFLYKNPNGWRRRSILQDRQDEENKTAVVRRYREIGDTEVPSINNERGKFLMSSTSNSTSEESVISGEPWILVRNFDFRVVVSQITEFIETWELTPATKFVVIAHEKCDTIEPFGERYYVEAHFSKPTPKCPNPLAVAKVYFYINVCRLLPRDYPVGVTYKFEGNRSMFHAMGEKKMSSNAFQRFMIDTVLHMKLAFYAELCDCRYLKNSAKREKEDQETGDHFKEQ